MDQNNHTVSVQEFYKDFTSPIPVKKIVNRILSGISPNHLTGLKTIFLTNVTALNHEMRRKKTLYKGKKVFLSDCRGWYNQKWQGQEANIQILVDNTIKCWPAGLLRISSFLQDVAFGNVLFHELGHHIHKVQAPEHKERENVAEKWTRKLQKHYFCKKYCFILVLSVPLFAGRVIINFFRKIFRKLKT